MKFYIIFYKGFVDMGFFVWLFRWIFRWVKWIRRLITGKGEIERAAATNDHQLLCKMCPYGRIVDSPVAGVRKSK